MRLLLISYYFPPCGGATVQRWLKWLPILVEKGFEVTVLTTKDGDYPVLDKSLLSEIPPDITIIRTKTFQWKKIWNLFFGNKKPMPYGNISKNKEQNLINRILIWVRLNLIIPDIRKFWNPYALKKAIEYLRTTPVDFVITTGPPHSTHLIGLKLKNKFNIKWIADWRDPWTSIYYLQLNPPSRISLYWHKKLETKVAQNADWNIVVSQHLASQLPTDKVSVIYSGYDDKRIPAPISPQTKTENKPFKLKFIGNITEGQRVDVLIQIIAKAFPDEDIELSFIGTNLSEEYKSLLQNLLPERYVCKNFLPHKEALKEMQDCQVLLLLINYYPGAEGMLTTKLFEYLASYNKILCLGPHNSEAEKLINHYEAGECFDIKESDAAIKYLRNLYNLWHSGESLKNEKDVSELSALNQVSKLIDLLHSLKD
ncbi:MAG: glycosyltransferase [Candidatus Cloacimonetes bacterium]|jgi:glycosyltransferase involved in cell wall biosynthesis|nr:glycosyltransferase [Candidatus Cloacimonadota bacterium]MDD5624749.1 glycosyltransferase [Candidatus Cloacimonadota bacterium]